MPLKPFIFLTLFILLFNTGCQKPREKTSSKSSQSIGDMKLYSFSADDQFYIGEAQPFVLPPDSSLKEALISLGQYLSETYFARAYDNRITHIRFEIMDIQEMPIDSGSLKIAIINMVDRDHFAMKQFFQGSTGGQTTFSILGATFMQPHLEHPLLDGLVFLYNGEILPELDHINLSGILTPRLVRFAAKRAIYHTNTKTAHSNGEWKGFFAM